jgi:hypothetical protein
MSYVAIDSRLAKPLPVVRVLVERAVEGLSLSLSFQPSSGGAPVEVRFLGVTQLRFRGEGVDLGGLVLLQSEDVEAQGWENIRYRVKDYEEEFVAFYCAEIAFGSRARDGA